MRRGVIRLGDQIKDIWFRDITNRIPPVSSASYIVFTDGSKYYAKNGDSGVIEFTDIDISNLLQNVINALYQRYGGGRVFIKRGIYYPSKTINIPDGIKLVIEGEGDATVFKYTSSFTLFYHKPSSPTWSSILVFRNFKIDRSGSGSNQANDIYILYAFYDEYDNITIVDDYREVAEDVGLYGRNSIVSVVHNCRFFNKASPVWFHSFLVHIYSNYARNTSLIGFGAGHLLPESVFGYKQPPGYPLDGLVVIEGNVCVDCGRADEAYAVDNESDNPYTYGAGIIRNNMLITQNYSVMNVGLICGNTDKCFIEDNIVNITAQNNVINVWWKSARPSLAVIRGNKVTATVQKNNIPFIVSADRAVIENNDINITVTADGSDTSSINWGMKLEALSLVFARNRVVYSYPNASYNQPYFVHMNGYMNQVVFRDNYINVLYPSNIFTSYGVTLEDIVNKNAEFVIVENNDINFSAGGPLTIGFWGSYSIPPLLKIVGNRFYSGSSSVNILIGLRANNTVKAIVLHNAFEGGVSGLSLYTDSGLTPTLIFLDRDAPIALISTGITTKYTKRNSGVATIPAGSTRVTVNHNLVASPSKLQITPLGQPPGKLWVENITNTSFDIVTDTAPASNLNVSWYAEV